jgi:hypothetical protein
MTSKLHTKIFHGQLYKQAPLEVQEIVETAPQSSFLAWGLPPRDPTPSNSNTGFPITSENGIGLKIPSYWRKWDPPGDCIPMNIDHGFPLKGCQRLAQGKPPRFHKTSNGTHKKKLDALLPKKQLAVNKHLFVSVWAKNRVRPKWYRSAW